MNRRLFSVSFRSKNAGRLGPPPPRLSNDEQPAGPPVWQPHELIYAVVADDLQQAIDTAREQLPSRLDPIDGPYELSSASFVPLVPGAIVIVAAGGGKSPS